MKRANERRGEQNRAERKGGREVKRAEQRRAELSRKEGVAET